MPVGGKLGWSKRAAIAALLVCAGALSPGHAQTARRVTIDWPRELIVAEQPLILSKSRSTVIATATPLRSLRLTHDIVDAGGVVIFAAGAKLAWSSYGGRVACEFLQRRGKDSFKCIEDSDGDGMLDTYSSVMGTEHYYSETTYTAFLMGEREPWKHVRLTQPVPVSVLEADPDPIVAEFRLVVNKFDPPAAPGGVGRSRLELCMDANLDGKLALYQLSVVCQPMFWVTANDEWQHMPGGYRISLKNWAPDQVTAMVAP